jgi:hypothetical protein
MADEDDDELQKAIAMSLANPEQADTKPLSADDVKVNAPHTMRQL